ncbi:aminopeptidase N-like isoform X2 [Eriocheir sinensis]|uniref:aminopeptidase N-like isoform X2 n=1 Tax=Eriocheir sinensis TaxID=95602 RepID=UPI0021C95D1F|nr:aminopeptidase N-like isoform X2 [Eriocheir sinensis]
MLGRGCLLFLVLIVAAVLFIAPASYSNSSPPSSRAAPTTSPPPPEDDNATTTPTAGAGGVRLPETLQPFRYEVRLRPYLSGAFRVEGCVRVEMMARAPTSAVTLHMTDIVTRNHTAKVVEAASGREIRVVSQRYAPLEMLYTAELAEELLEGGNYTFSVCFLGTLGQQARGFYRSSYTKENGETSWVASTQFQVTDARRAFPCFDEPQLKATFKVFLARREGMTALSNMPLVASTPIEGEEGWVWDEFAESVPMPTYLVAFAISDYPSRVLRGGKDNSTLIRVSTRAAKLSRTSLVGQIAPRLLDFYGSYFSLPYPLPKLDLIAPPENSFGGMENWGLITFRESGLLYTPGQSSLRTREWITYLVAHEMAHQWFGNLVTLKWWVDLWLNEGFATYLGDVGVDQAEPSWGMLDIFVVKRLQSVMALDALRSSHPVSVPIPDPAIINQIFDIITYDKGASIIRMMGSFLTEAAFRNGLKNYLTTLKYKNAEQDDLWRHLTEAAHAAGTLPPELSVKAIMDTWTLQMGFPVVTVTRLNDTTAAVTQEYFVLDDDSNSSSSSSSTSSSSSASPSHEKKWWVPLTYTTGDSPDFNDTRVKLWLSGEEGQAFVEVPQPSQWVVFNVRQNGYYRVNYDLDNWRLLTRQLQEDHRVIHATNRAQIIDDAFNLARAGRLSYATVLDLMSYLAKEKEYVPWRATFANIRYLYSMFHRDPAYGALKNYILSLIQPLYDSVGFEDNLSDPYQTRLLRSDMLAWACRLGHAHCRNMSLSLYRRWMANPTDFEGISPNLMLAVGCTAVDAGGEAEWNFAWKQSQLVDALGCTNELWLLMRYLEGAFNASSGIRRQDAAMSFRRVAKHAHGAILAWDYMRAHWPKIAEYIGVTFFALPRMVEDVTGSFNTPQQLQELQEFERQYQGQLLTAGTAVQQAVEAAQINLAWMRHNRMFIVEWLAGRGFTSDLASL